VTSTAPSPGRLQYQRQRDIYGLALRHGSVDVSALAKKFNVTTETIRRDLSELQDRLLLRRVHGGAVPYERRDHEPMVDARGMLNAEEKLRIGREATLEVPQRGAIIIDSGSTGQRFAEVFPGDREVHVVTNSLMIGAALVRRGVTRLTVLGGAVRTNTFAMVDASTVDTVRKMSVDVLFISCDGLSFGHGLTTPYSDEALLKRAMIESARRVVAMVDSSKLGNEQLYGFAGLDEIDVLITDDRAEDTAVEALAGRGVEVRRA
jgi:DeoR family transcriptional regulator, fructose operon transcriptional repressor